MPKSRVLFTECTLGVSIGVEDVVIPGEDVEFGGLVVFKCLKSSLISVVYELSKVSI